MVINLRVDSKIGQGEQKEIKRHTRTALKENYVPYVIYLYLNCIIARTRHRAR